MEAATRAEQDKSSICDLESELKKFRVQFEETVDAHEAEVKNLNNQIVDLNRQKEAALREVSLISRSFCSTQGVCASMDC